MDGTAENLKNDIILKSHFICTLDRMDGLRRCLTSVCSDDLAGMETM
jgi:hypothetical protein